ncbi:amidohydrolase [Merdimmobilis hominis]|uniref:Peptidase M20 domain-containing protein 2 n=2 Tax=Oscillospiraceae TaxID=216572 RepID=A0A6N2TIR7_9FIRM|nr:amidohydrolase [Merdimmobilis hominis]MCD4835767.1 amidohydrolase [Merdimmobilis hominis]PWL56448.1 MAG: amidohydrolase [Oscillospiraceae bacterium]
MATREELKQRACEAIDKNRDKIIALGDAIFSEPELGYKEFKTAEKVKKAFDEMGYTYTDGHAITGIIAPLKGGESKVKVAIMGELDAVVAPNHRCANKETGAAHSCGHHAQIASMVGAAYAFKDTGILEELGGDVVLMAVPAEEYVELGYRNELRKAGKIWFLGGKQEFVRLGLYDDIDICVMQHTELGNVINCGQKYNGFVGKLVQYIGKEAHAGGAPHLGINALNAAQIGLMAVNANRETFQDKDQIRVHPIITKGGDLVNVVPADVRIETYVRGNNVPAILDGSFKVTRAFKAGGDAVGAQCEVTELPGYMPFVVNNELDDVMYQNALKLVDTDKIKVDLEGPGTGGSTDAGDLSHIMPIIHAHVGGAEGIFHSESFEVPDKELAYITAAKLLATTTIDLLADGAAKALEIKSHFKPLMTKEEYLKDWGHIE